MKPNRMIAWLLMPVLLAGCATPKRTAFQAAPGYNGETPAAKRIGVIVDAHVTYTKALLPPTPADRAEATALQTRGIENVQAGINRALAARGYTVVMLPLDDDARAVLKEYYAVRGDSLVRPFLDAGGKIGRVAALPAAAALAAKAGVDGIVIVNGRDAKATTGAVVVFAVVMALAVVATAAAISGGSPAPVLPGPAPYDADFAFIGRAGKIEFYERANMAVLNRNSVQRANTRFSYDLAAPPH
ncbi:MAG TPA: hypothetical protein VKC56_00720 [Gallionellaceae bacterium]|nr:hypothetical protein [Gallionellaceae bacterium]